MVAGETQAHRHADRQVAANLREAAGPLRLAVMFRRWTTVFSAGHWARTRQGSAQSVTCDIPGCTQRKVGFPPPRQRKIRTQNAAVKPAPPRSPLSRTTLVVGVLCLLPVAWPAAADIYAHVDAAGVVHYTNVPVEAGFEVVLESPPEPTAGGGEVSLRVPLALINRRAAAYEGIIREAASANELEPELLRAVISVESAFNPRAVSRAGARGLMQLMPQTARRYGVRDSFDPRQNVHGGARYLRDLVERFDNDLELVVAAYNAGENAVERHGRQIPPYRETRQYVPRVLDLYRAFAAPVGTH